MYEKFLQDISFRLDDFKCLYSTCHQILLDLTKEGRKVKAWDMYSACDMRHGYRVTRNPWIIMYNEVQF